MKKNIKKAFLYAAIAFVSIASVKSQTEKILRVQNNNSNVHLNYNLRQSSFIKDGRYFTNSCLDDAANPYKAFDFQKTDLAGVFDNRTSPATGVFNFSLKSIVPAPNMYSVFNKIEVTSYIKGNGNSNYFVGNIENFPSDISSLIIGEINDGGNIVNYKLHKLFDLAGHDLPKAKINKMILFNNTIYAVGSLTNSQLFMPNPSFGSNYECVLLTFDLSLNLLSKNVYSTMFNGKHGFGELSEGVDLLVNSNNELCVIGNIFDHNSPIPGVPNNISSVFGSPNLAVGHNYTFFSKIDISTKTILSTSIYGSSATPLEAFGARKFLELNGNYYLFGTYEVTTGHIKPVIVKLDAAMNYVSSIGFGDYDIAKEVITDAVYDANDNSFYLTTRPYIFNNSQCLLTENFFENVTQKGSLYKVDNSLNVIARRQMNISDPNAIIALETITLDRQNSSGRLIMSGVKKEIGNYDKIIWYLNASDFEIPSTCSTPQLWEEYNSTFEFAQLRLISDTLNSFEIPITYSDLTLPYYLECAPPVTTGGGEGDPGPIDPDPQFVKNVNPHSLNNSQNISISQLSQLLSSSNNNIKSLEIFSITGQLISRNSNVESLSSLTTGVYLLQLTYNDGNCENKKLLVNK